MRRKKVAVLTLVVGESYRRQWQFATVTKQEYCRKHGYDFIEGNEKDIGENRPISWHKIPLIQKHLNRYDYILWVDGDAMIANPSQTIESLFGGVLDQGDLIIKSDWNGLNMGVFLIKNTPWAKEFLHQVRQCPIESLRPEYAQKWDFWWEQAVVRELYDRCENVRDNICVLPADSLKINQYPDRDGYHCNETAASSSFFRRGDFILHFCSSAGFRDVSFSSFLLERVQSKGAGFIQKNILRLKASYYLARVWRCILRACSQLFKQKFLVAALSRAQRSNL